MIKSVSSSDVKIRKPNTTKQSSKVNTNVTGVQKVPCKNSSNVYKNNFLAM